MIVVEVSAPQMARAVYLSARITDLNTVSGSWRHKKHMLADK